MIKPGADYSRMERRFMTKGRLIIFIKKPEQGRVKTRLAAGIGEEKALQAYYLLLKKTFSEALETSLEIHLFSDSELPENSLWDHPRIHQHLQDGNDLGEKMQHAFALMFEEDASRPACIIGSDCFEITARIMEQAFERLQDQDMVIGPTHDGGYYLLGMKALQPVVFQGIEWSTASVFEETVQKMNANRLSHAELPVLRDIDYREDLMAFPALVEQLGL